MKKHVLIGSVLLAAVSTFSQNAGRPKPTGLLNTKMIADSKFGGPELAPANASPVKPSAVPVRSGAKTNVMNWNSFTASMNIYGVVIPYSKPLQWNDELNAVTFVHRKSPSYVVSPTPASNAANGAIVAMVSTDCGENWDSTAVYANDNFWGRYPNGGIYNPPGNTSISNAYVVAAGPVTGNSASTWIGNFYASKKLGTYDNIPSTAPGAQQVMTSTPPFAPNVPSRHDFAAYAFTSTDDGKVRVLAGITDDATTSDTAVMLMTGVFNSGTNTFDWSGRIFDPPTTVESDGTENWVSRPTMAWNEAGTIGYVVIMGSRLGNTGSNVGFQPIVYKTTDAGATWSLENGINFNDPQFDGVKNKLWNINGDTSLVIPNFLWLEGFDAAVDANNKLHIFSSLVGHTSNHPDSLNFISQWSTERYLWPHTPGAQPYLFDFTYDGTNATPAWSYMVVDSMSSEGISALPSNGGYQDNPWDMDPSQSNQKVRIDSRIQMSRTPDGKYLLYSWAESDTAFTDNQKKWNNIPNIKVRLYDVAAQRLHPEEIDVTSDASGDVANRAMYHFLSPKFKFNSKVGEDISVTVPLTISNSNPYTQLGTNTHWFSCAAITFTVNTVGIADHGSANALNSSIFPNPAKTNATVNVSLTSASKVQVQVMNTVGQVVKTVNTQGQAGANSINIDLNGLSSGIYLVSIKADNAASTKKLIIE